MAYFANSTEGDKLEQQCERCILGEKHCPVKDVQMLFNYDQCGPSQKKLKDAMNLLVNEDGICQLRPLLPEPIWPAQGKGLFG